MTKHENVKISDVETKLQNRLETNIGVTELANKLNVEEEIFERDGLGLWKGFAVVLDGMGTMIVASPKEGDWGASIWLEQKPGMRTDAIMDMIKRAVGRPGIMFMTPEGVALPTRPPRP